MPIISLRLKQAHIWSIFIQFFLTWAQVQGIPMLSTDEEPKLPIATEQNILNQAQTVFDQSGEFEQVEMSYTDGILFVKGKAFGLDSEKDIRDKLKKISGIKSVSLEISQSADLKKRLKPVWQRTKNKIITIVSLLPLLLIGFFIIAIATLFANKIGKKKGLFSKLVANSFLEEIIRQSIRVGLILISIFVMLELIGATSVIGALLGAAGVFGLAVSFAFRDIIENYIAGILLSIRQPFKPLDHIIVDGIEGLVLNMTTRATMIKSFDGNNVTVPNTKIFKEVIINYSKIPERRFDFEIGIDADADADLGREIGMKTLTVLEGVLDDPRPFSTIPRIGDSSIQLKFFGWIDQREYDFDQVRSAAITAVKNQIESHGIAIPEPLYSVKIIGLDKVNLTSTISSKKTAKIGDSSRNLTTKKPSTKKSSATNDVAKMAMNEIKKEDFDLLTPGFK